MKQQNFCIVGLGLLGGSYAMALSNAGYHVSAIDIAQSSIDYALERGFIAEGAVSDFDALLADADAVVLCLYPNALVDWLRAHQAKLRPGTLITDVCGVKCGVVSEVQSFLRNDVEFIASHPMAGREVSGVQHANSAMFAPANFIVTPTENNSEDGIAFAKKLGQVLGFAHITQLSCDEHDKMIGYVSQLTHAIAVSLMNATDNTHLVEYTGDSFRDLTRIARINEHLWSELFLMNREYLTIEIDQFVDTLLYLRQKLNDDDAEGLKTLFRTSTQRRALFDKKA